MSATKIVCNEFLYRMTAAKTSVSPEQVEEFFSFICEFTEKKINEGSLETVMIPHFGKFRPKLKQVQFFADLNVVKSLIPKTPKNEVTKNTR